jgi:hypothetical protein
MSFNMALSIERQLPEEILDHIVSLASRDALTKLCLTSRQLNRLATTHLYSNITLGSVGYYEDSYYEGKKTYINHLARLLFASPVHAALVTSVFVLPAWGPSPEDEQREEQHWTDAGSSELETLLRQQLARFALDDEQNKSVYEKIRTGTNEAENAIVALLLLSLPNLQRLDMNFGSCDDHSDFVTVFELLAAHSNLTDDQHSPRVDVLVKGEDDKYPHQSIHVAALMHMPKLRSLYGLKMGDHEGGADPDFARLKPRSSPVEYIELRTSKLHKDNFRHLVNATIPGKLKTLNYEIGCTWAWCQMQAHHQTLENLCLSHEDFYPHQFDNDDDKPYPCDFKPFTALKRLKVAPVYIWGHEGFTNQTSLTDRTRTEMLWKALPENLEQLWICRAESQEPSQNANDGAALRFEADCLLPALYSVLQHKEDFPKFDDLRIEFPPGNWPKDEIFDGLESFCRRAESSGIQTTVILTDTGHGSVERKWGWYEEIEWSECLHNHDAKKRWIKAGEVDELARIIREARDQDKEAV